jgi:hypothetical protein
MPGANSNGAGREVFGLSRGRAQYNIRRQDLLPPHSRTPMQSENQGRAI